MIRAIALDDERPALEVIDAFCSRIETVDLCRTFTRTSEARTYLANSPVDLLFLDINMPAESGIDFFKGIDTQPNKPQPMVVFTTAYSEFAVESYDLQAIDYLLKPFTFERFRQAVDKAVRHYHLQRPPEEPGKTDSYILLRVDYSLVKVMLTDILFIEGLDNYLKIHLTEGHPLVVRLTMKAMLEKLPPSEFFRVHRSFIVPFQRIQSVRNKIITIGSEEIPLGNSYEADFFAGWRG